MRFCGVTAYLLVCIAVAARTHAHNNNNIYIYIYNCYIRIEERHLNILTDHFITAPNLAGINSATPRILLSTSFSNGKINRLCNFQ